MEGEILEHTAPSPIKSMYMVDQFCMYLSIKLAAIQICLQKVPANMTLYLTGLVPRPSLAIIKSGNENALEGPGE